MGGCAAEIGDLFTTIRYTQRGVAPSSLEGPFSIESHMADALAVLDAFKLEKAWMVGHAWGAHLALHLAVAHPERLHGIACLDPLGAAREVCADFHAALIDPLTDEHREQAEAIQARVGSAEASEEELVEVMGILWPSYFFNPAAAPKAPTARGPQCTFETNSSIAAHFEARTLEEGLPQVRKLPALFVHGLQDPMPLRASLDTAKLIRRARVARIPQCGHFPWVEQPGYVNRMLRGLIAQL
jgi:pimeloyl-ACP methyl ester carboxylesterase